MAEIVSPHRKLSRVRCGRFAVWGLVGSIVWSAGLWLQPVQAQLAEARVAAFVEALRQAAPQTGRVDDGLYSDWQLNDHQLKAGGFKSFRRT